jgi:hypothetical protein
MKILDLLTEDAKEDELRKIVQSAIVSGDRSQFDMLDPGDKKDALKAAGLITVSDLYSYGKDSDLSDRRLQKAIIQRQQDQYDVEIGPEKRNELNRKADELVELRRQQLRKEALQDAESAFTRAETVAQRQAEMEKIKRKFEHDLSVINTEHKNNMEAIRTGNSHEINKMDKEHNQEKAQWNREDAREREKQDREDAREKARLDRETPAQQQNQPAAAAPEPEPAPEKEIEEPEFEKFKADIYKLSGIPLPAPAPAKKPSKYDNSDAIDVDAREVPNKDNNAVPGLPAPKKEGIAYYRDLIAEMDAPASGDKEMSKEEWDSKFKNNPEVKIINPLRMMPKDGSYFNLATQNGQAVGVSKGSMLVKNGGLGPATHVAFATPKTVDQVLKDFNLEKFSGTNTASASTRTPRPGNPVKVLTKPWALNK